MSEIRRFEDGRDARCECEVYQTCQYCRPASPASETPRTESEIVLPIGSLVEMRNNTRVYVIGFTYAVDITGRQPGWFCGYNCCDHRLNGTIASPIEDYSYEFIKTVLVRGNGAEALLIALPTAGETPQQQDNCGVCGIASRFTDKEGVERCDICGKPIVVAETPISRETRTMTTKRLEELGREKNEAAAARRLRDGELLELITTARRAERVLEPTNLELDRMMTAHCGRQIRLTQSEADVMRNALRGSR